MLILLETKMTEHKGITETLGFDRQLQSAIVGRSGWIIIMWKTDTLYLKEISITPQSIHAMFKVLPFYHNWHISAIYASTNYFTRLDLWDSLTRIAQNINGDWFMERDFNEVL